MLSRMTLDEKLGQMHCFGCVYTIDEEKEMIFELTKDDFSYIGFDMNKTYLTGKVKVMVKDLEVTFDINFGKIFD